jgi:hypothetical protein
MERHIVCDPRRHHEGGCGHPPPQCRALREDHDHGNGQAALRSEAKLDLSARIFEYYSRNAEKLLEPQELPVAEPREGNATLVCEPLGVILGIEPWNFPFYQIARIIAPQLSAANSSRLTPPRSALTPPRSARKKAIQAPVPSLATAQRPPSRPAITAV